MIDERIAIESINDCRLETTATTQRITQYTYTHTYIHSLDRTPSIRSITMRERQIERSDTACDFIVQYSFLQTRSNGRIKFMLDDIIVYTYIHTHTQTYTHYVKKNFVAKHKTKLYKRWKKTVGKLP